MCSLSAEHAEIYASNQHLRQVFANQYPFHVHSGAFTETLRIIQRDAENRFAPRRPYARRQGEVGGWGSGLVVQWWPLLFPLVHFFILFLFSLPIL